MEKGMLDKIRRSKATNKDRADLRIKKTKERLENAFFELIREKSLYDISVRELCREADITVITFYSHYADKFALLDDIFDQKAEYAERIFNKSEKENNAERDLTQSFCNLLDCVLYVLNEISMKLNMKVRDIDPYIFFSIVNRTQNRIGIMLDEQEFEPPYTARLIASFMSYGMWGYVLEAQDQGITFEEISGSSKQLIRRVMKERIFSGVDVLNNEKIF